ncbi:MAG TPA: acyl-CoA dehydrogenase [Acidimicrobiaceae bacterium]|nr:acyl-CoA dehydrogenase [Actinomycetota bacterium]NCG41487.1 acyl-CoA dehydrogenase [Actinomycetota bacterium]HAN08434.1 acyl-CoA dehydrogenase [Acidimicrobiaceae bacterium]
MDFEYNAKTMEHVERLETFMEAHVYPAEREHHDFIENPDNLWQQPPVVEELKAKAQEAGIWNWFLPAEYGDWSPGFTNLEYAPLAEVMGRVPWSFEVFNCSAPDRGNMEVLAKYGTSEQQDQWLRPLMEGRIRSTYGMTEPQVASSDATNMELQIERDGDHYVLNGRKWWSSNIYHPLCEFVITMGVTNPDNNRHQRHSMVIVPKDTPGLEIVRPLSVFGNFHSPAGHGELAYHNVRVPIDNIILGEGRGFEIAQGRLGPGRFQYAMTNVGMAQRMLDMMCARAEGREPFGSKISEFSSTRQDIARARCAIEQARLLVLKAAAEMDKSGAKGARDYISMVKIVGPKLAHDVAERAMQIFGGKGVSGDTPIAEMFVIGRLMRIADGPDEVHMNQLAKLTLAQAEIARQSGKGGVDWYGD